MKLSKHAKFWALGALGGVGLFALGVFAQQTLEINPSEQDLFSDLKAVFFLDRNGDEIKSIVRWNASGSTLVTAPTSELTGGEAKNTLQNNASIIGSTDSSNTSAGAFLIATNGGKVQWESMQSFIWGANNTTLSGFNTIAVATKDTNINADNALALASKNTNITAKDAIAIGWEDIKLKGQASLAIWSKIDSAAQGAMVFNAKNERLNLNNESNNTFVINAKNGLIVNTNTSANPKIQLTVNGAIKLWEVNNAPAQASPYISTKKVGNVSCVCGKVNNENIAISKYSRNNKQHAEICQKVCNNETPTLPGQCGAAATNYPLGQTQWSTDDFCQWGLGYAGAKPAFPALGGQTTWTCESFPSGGVNCTATRKWCGDGIKAAGEQCDLGTNNGRLDSNCSANCENVKAPKCGVNAKTYLGSDVAWAQPNGFCTDGSVLGEATPAFWNGSTSWQKNWTCKNKNGKNLTCSATKQPPMVAGECNKNKVNICISGVFSGETSLKNGTRWTCKGEHGGSSKTCSTCDSGYTYNETSTKCEANCANPIYRHTNGVTIKAADCAEAGKEYMFEGQKYYVAWWTTSIAEKIKSGYPANRIVTTKITSMHSALEDLTTFNQDISNWDTSNVTSMHAMFYNAKTFDQDLSYWNTSKVTDIGNLFRGAHKFDHPLNNWDTSKVTYASQAFLEAHNFNQPLNKWITHNITDMGGMFREARSFNQNINDWDVRKVTNMKNMFTNAEKFNQPLNKWKLNSTLQMSQMFYGADSFDQPLDNWDIWPIPNENLKDAFIYAPLFRNNQPYCNWAKWTTKKWNFVNMGLNACATSPSKVNGQCKAYPWNHPAQPATATVNGCVAGDYQDIADDTNKWKWKCNGKNGGTSIECSASKQSTCPSGFTASNGKCVKWECKEETTKLNLCQPKFGASSAQIAICLSSIRKDTCPKSYCEWMESASSLLGSSLELASTSSLKSGICRATAEALKNENEESKNRKKETHLYECHPRWWFGGGPLIQIPPKWDPVRGCPGGYDEVDIWYSKPSESLSLWVDKKCSLNITKTTCQKDLNCEWELDTAASVKKVAKCIDSEWNEIEDNECKNAGQKPTCTTEQSTCPSGFTTSNGKCVKWECKKDTAAPVTLVPLGNCTGRGGTDSLNITCSRRWTDKTSCEKYTLCEWKEWPTSSSEVWMCKTKTKPFPPLGSYSCRKEVQDPTKKTCGIRLVPMSHYAPDLSLFCEEMKTKQKCLKNSDCDWKRVETVSGKAAKCVDSEWNTVQESNCNNAWIKPSCNKECSPWFSRYKGKCVAWRCSIWECKYALTWVSWTCQQINTPYLCTRSPDYNCKRDWTASPIGDGQGVSWCLSEEWLRLPDTQCDPAKKSELNCGTEELI